MWPSFAETSSRVGPSNSFAEHLLTAYARSFGSIIRAQLQGKAAGPERAAMVRLLSCQYVQHALRIGSGLRQESLQKIAGRGTMAAQALESGDVNVATGEVCPVRNKKQRSEEGVEGRSEGAGEQAV